MESRVGTTNWSNYCSLTTAFGRDSPSRYWWDPDQTCPEKPDDEKIRRKGREYLSMMDLDNRESRPRP